jgi:exopolysaccharide biosynthesis polyprenyl glycosylphosphotransferase
VALTTVLALYFQNLYTDFRIRSRIDLIQEVVLVIGVNFIVQAVLSYINRELVMARYAMLIASAVLLVAFPLWRLAYANVIYKGLGIDTILFLGSDTLGIELAEWVREKPELGLTGLGFVDDSRSKGMTVAGLPVLGASCELRQIVEHVKPDRIVVSLAERRNALPVDVLLELRFSGIRIEEAAAMYEMAFGRVTTRRLRPSQLIFSSELGPEKWKIRVQAIYSFVLASIGLLVALPIMLLVVAAVRLTSRGPVLFRQQRVGLNGRVFMLYKFRSMVVNAEESTGAVWAKKNDPRVTRVGGFLRRTRLDELPQLFNVLRGDMAIVGPRPERPEFVSVLSEQIPFYRQRHAVKPGVTGWAQINHKYGDTIEDTIIKLEYDLYYIKNLSTSLDAYIIFHTAKVMLASTDGQ